MARQPWTQEQLDRVAQIERDNAAFWRWLARERVRRELLRR